MDPYKTIPVTSQLSAMRQKNDANRDVFFYVEALERKIEDQRLALSNSEMAKLRAKAALADRYADAKRNCTWATFDRASWHAAYDAVEPVVLKCWHCGKRPRGGRSPLLCTVCVQAVERELNAMAVRNLSGLTAVPFKAANLIQSVPAAAAIKSGPKDFMCPACGALSGDDCVANGNGYMAAGTPLPYQHYSRLQVAHNGRAF